MAARTGGRRIIATGLPFISTGKSGSMPVPREGAEAGLAWTAPAVPLRVMISNEISQLMKITWPLVVATTEQRKTHACYYLA
jgi:hypothetical protein